MSRWRWRARTSRASLVLGAFATLVSVWCVVADVEARPWSWLGVRIRDLSEREMEELSTRHGLREGFGVVIVEVLEGTPAAGAGLKSGDIVVAFGDRPVVETRMLQRLIAAAPPEQESHLTVLRSEGRQRVSVRLTTMPRPIAGERIAAAFGFALRDPLTGGEPAGPRPLAAASPTVTGVAKGSAADKAGLEVGDVIVQVNDQATLTRDAVREALADAREDRPLSVTVRRGPGLVSLTLPAP